MAKMHEKLLQLAEHHEKVAAGIRIAVSELMASEKVKALGAIGGKIKAAGKIRNGKVRSKAEAAAFVAKVASTLDRGKPMDLKQIMKAMGEHGHELRDGRQLVGSLGSLTRYGYAKKTKKGYVATGKTYVPRGQEDKADGA
jgi:hypothetical protein